MTLEEAIEAVEAGKVQRICAPAKWRVWRDETGVCVEVMQ